MVRQGGVWWGRRKGHVENDSPLYHQESVYNDEVSRSLLRTSRPRKTKMDFSKEPLRSRRTRISIPLDLSTWSFIPLPPSFVLVDPHPFYTSYPVPSSTPSGPRSAYTEHVVTSSLSFTGFSVHHSCSVTFPPPCLSTLFILCKKRWGKKILVLVPSCVVMD